MGREIITSRQNPLVKYVCGLALKKKRSEEGLFRFDGIKLLCEALSSDVKIKYIVYKEPADERVLELVSEALANGKISEESLVAVNEAVFDKISEERAPEGVVTVAHMPAIHGVYEKASVEREDRVLIAESLRDPGNLGTVIRSCYALGIDTLILTDDCADLCNQKTARAAMGALFRLKTLSVPFASLPSVIGELREQGRRVFATALSDRSLDIGEITLERGDCFVIGNEGHGLSDSTVSACTSSVIIPMREDAESLNAAAAAAICIWETVRAR